MPTLARPEVDVLEGLTTAIIVDQERMGANSRSTVGTATDANAMLRVLFSRLGKPHIGSSNAFSFNVPSVRGGRAITIEKGGGKKTEKRTFTRHRRHVPALRGHGIGQRHRPVPAVRRQQVAQRGRAHDPRLHRRRLVRCASSAASGFLDPDKPIRKYTKKELHDFLHKEPTKVKVDEHQPHLRGADPEDPEVVPVQGRRRDAAAHPGVRGARGHLHHLSRVRRHPAQRGRPVLQDQGDQHRRRLRDADQRPGRVGARSGRAVRRAAAGDAAGDARLVRGDRAGLPQPRPAVRHAVGRRGAAHQDDPPPRVVAHRRDLRLRRADDRAAPPRHPADERPAAAAARQGQHRPRGRAQAGDDRDRRPRRRPRPRRRHRRRRGGLRGHRRRAAGQRHAHRASPERPGLPEAVGADAVGCDGGARRPHAQPAERRRRHPARRAGGGDRRGRVGQELADPRLGVWPGRGGVGRPDPDPRLAAEQPGDVHRPAGADPQGVREGQRREARPVQRQLRGRLSDLQRRRGDLHRPRR